MQKFKAAGNATIAAQRFQEGALKQDALLRTQSPTNMSNAA